MSPPIHDPKDFFKLFCQATKMKVFDPTDRACVITRSPANYGEVSTVIIEWEGSPPRFSIYYLFGGMPIINGKRVSEKSFIEVVGIIDAFLDAHPANADGSPVWIGTCWRGRP